MEEGVYKNQFIVIEGGEGSGKSTLIHYLKEELELLNKKVVIHREPGGSEFTEDVRHVFMKYDDLEALTITHLMNAQRQHNINRIIRPALESGHIVLSDRFTPSTLVYQGYMMDQYEDVSQTVIDIPQTTIFVNVKPEVGLQRIKDNNREQNYLDKLSIDKHQKVYEGYLKLAEEQPDKYWDYVIDGEQPLETIRKQCQLITRKIVNNL